MQMMDGSSWTCSTFEAQKWRKRKCKHCFQDIELHTLEAREDNNSYSISDNYTRHASLGDLCLSNDDSQAEFEDDLNREVTEITRSIDELEKWNNVDDAHVGEVSEEAVQCRTLVKDCAHVFRKRSRTHDGVRGSQRGREFLSNEIRVSSKDDLQISNTASFEEENLPMRGKCIMDTRAILSRLSTVEFSSTSSLASFDPLEDNTLSSYSCSGSRDNLDGFASGDDLCFPDGSNEVQAAASEGKLVHEYREKIEQLEDELKSLEREKGMEAQASDRELQGLKLELATLSARENISIVKNRLEIEGKNQVIEELRDEIVHLQSSIDDLSLDRHSEESRQDILQGEVRRRDKRILCLEEEKKSLEERLSLAEDLQQNDRDLLDVLRHQLTTLESDLLTSEDRKKQLEKEIKNLKIVDSELKEEKENSQKFRKHAEFLSGKLKLREQHVSYLEDDNVQMQQQKTELEGKLEKSRTKVDNLNMMVKELKKDILNYSQEIKQLSEENCQLEQAHWQIVVNQSDASGQLEYYVKDLEKRICQGEARIRELECENESLISQSSEMLENLVSLQNEADDSKRQLELMTESYNRLQTSKTDQDKRMITLQRKLKKLQKEKKRFQIEKQEAEEKISQLKSNDEKVLTKCDDIEKGYKMLQLKLQSTEAKLTMVERNKIYMESKLDEYERKYKSSKDVLSKVNCVVDRYLDDVEGGCVDVGSLGLESIEVKLFKVIELSNRSTSELDVALRKNQEFVTAMNSVHVELEKLRNELNSARMETVMLKYQLEDREKQCGQLESCFATNITCLAKQNDVLEEKLVEMKEWKSVIEHYEGQLNSKNTTMHDTVGDLDSQGADKLCDSNSNGIHSNETDNSTLDGSSKAFANTFCLDIKEKPEQSVQINNDEIVCDTAELSEIALFDTREDLGDSQDAEILKEDFVQECLMNEEKKFDMEKAEVSRKVAEEDHVETPRCASFDDERDRIASDTGSDCSQGGYSSNSIEENTTDVTPVEKNLGECEEQLVEENRAIEDDIASIEGNGVMGDSNEAAAYCEMDPERPCTSVKCVFKGETNGVGSILDYSAMHLHKDDDEKFRGDLEWMRLGDRKKSIETNAHYYTVAVSNFDTSNGRPLKGPISDARPVKNSDTAVRRHNFGKGSLMQISQEESGAITLTIPRSSLDETIEDEIDDERVDQLTSKSRTNVEPIRVENHTVPAKEQAADSSNGIEIQGDLSQT